jgi:hypothetical protein
MVYSTPREKKKKFLAELNGCHIHNMHFLFPSQFFEYWFPHFTYAHTPDGQVRLRIYCSFTLIKVALIVCLENIQYLLEVLAEPE